MKWDTKVIGVAMGIAGSGFLGYNTYQIGKLNGHGEVYEQIAHQVVDLDHNGLVSDQELSDLIGRMRKISSVEKGYILPGPVSTRADLEDALASHTSISDWQRFVERETPYKFR